MYLHVMYVCHFSTQHNDIRQNKLTDNDTCTCVSANFEPARIRIDTDNQTEPIRGRINLTKYGLLVPVPQWYTSRERICGIGHFYG